MIISSIASKLHSPRSAVEITKAANSYMHWMDGSARFDQRGVGNFVSVSNGPQSRKATPRHV